MAFTVFDVWDQALLTDIIQRPPAGRAPGAAEDTGTFLGDTIAPLKSHAARLAKVRVSELKPFGKGQLRAPDATPPLFKPAVTWTEQLIELALLDEMERIPEEEWLSLNSPDDNRAKSAGASLIDRGRILRLRNQRLTEYMRWQAFSGVLTLTYPPQQGGSQLVINYGLPSGHTPTMSTLWSDSTNADPVSDIQALSQKLADDSGFYASHVHMNSTTYNYLILSQKVRAAINFYAAGSNTIQRARKQDILNLFETFSQRVDLVIYDNGYREIGQTGIGRPSLTKYLPDGYVLVTTDYMIDGHNIADCLNGEVVVSSGYNSTTTNVGDRQRSCWTISARLTSCATLRLGSQGS
jgi:hypothetical protein